MLLATRGKNKVKYMKTLMKNYWKTQNASVAYKISDWPSNQY